MTADEAYARWKNWGAPTVYSVGDKKIWDDLHAFAEIKSGQRLLEIGFGQGSHLHYCQSKGVISVGLEQNKTGYDLARAAGLQVYLGDLQALPPAENKFDVIVAMDVVEHIPLNELTEMMRHLRSLLNPNGKILLTFPNGASPFGRLQQHGDLTHINTFNRSSMEQLCVLTGFKLIRYQDFPEYFEYRTPAQWIKAPVRFIVRAIIRFCVKSYFNEPLGLSVAAILE
jgi:2-polyprenyl-3-methyl-5-hydroxy-6-metoxy-1,4-benzoquinol methylase